MQSSGVEIWARKKVAQVKLGQVIEDALVEFKLKWPETGDLHKHARRLAGHANAAAGENIMWLFGVDEKDGIVGVLNNAESWYQQISKYFIEEVPRLLMDVSFQEDGKTLVAIVFETDRRPYLIKNEEQGKIESEVPWREQTRVRTAKRSELLIMLGDTQQQPDYEFLDAKLEMDLKQVKDGKPYYKWNFKAGCYVIPKGRDQVVLPRHYSKITFQLPSITRELEMETEFTTDMVMDGVNTSGFPKYKNASATISVTPNEIICAGPGKFIIKATCITDVLPKKILEGALPGAMIRGTFRIAGTDTPKQISLELAIINGNKDRTHISWEI